MSDDQSQPPENRDPRKPVIPSEARNLGMESAYRAEIPRCARNDVGAIIGNLVQQTSPGPLLAEAAAATARAHPLAALLAGQVLQGGEIIQLILRPSWWFIILDSLKFSGVVLIALIASKIYDESLPGEMRWYVEGAVFFIAGRLCISTLQWHTRLYVMTDRRILKLSGIFRITVAECPLRQVAVARLVRTTRERLMRLGSIEIIPQDDHPVCVWQTISRPRDILKIIRTAIARSKHSFPGN